MFVDGGVGATEEEKSKDKEEWFYGSRQPSRVQETRMISFRCEIKRVLRSFDSIVTNRRPLL